MIAALSVLLVPFDDCDPSAGLGLRSTSGPGAGARIGAADGGERALVVYCSLIAPPPHPVPRSVY